MIVDLVHVTTHDGVRLDGTWRKPHPEQASQLGVDVVIFHHGVGGNFLDLVCSISSDALPGQGVRGPTRQQPRPRPVSRAVVGEDAKRLGAAYEDMDDCRYDWEAWVDFTKRLAIAGSDLWGHSLGATKSICYMATQGDPRVTCVVAGSPPRFSYSAYAALESGEAFRQIAGQAQQYDAGHPGTLLDTIYPIPLLVTAEVFIQKYGPEEKYDILQHIPMVQCPCSSWLGQRKHRR